MKYKTLFALFSLCALVACQSVKEQLGVGRNSPDEFLVVKRAPLTLPPDYDLRPPVDGAFPSASLATSQAKSALLGSDGASQDSSLGTAEGQLLEKMGAVGADSDIRSVINQENGYIALQNKTVGDKLIFWKEEPTEDERIPSSVVDAKAEAERLKKNETEGKAVNDGKVPVIEKKKSTIDKLF